MEKIVSWAASPLDVENRFLKTVISPEQFELLETKRSGLAWVKNDVGEIHRKYITGHTLPERMYISPQEREHYIEMHELIAYITDMILFQPSVKEITGEHSKYFGGTDTECLLCHLLNGVSSDFYDQVNPEGSSMYFDGFICSQCPWFLSVRENPIVKFLAV